MRGASQPPRTAAARNESAAVAHDQHPDHQFGIDRRPANIAVEGLKILAQLSQNARHHRIDPAQQMARRNAFFEVEQIEKWL
jgi:hypothetical protein